jgi:hypothetical protein
VFVGCVLGDRQSTDRVIGVRPAASGVVARAAAGNR